MSPGFSGSDLSDTFNNFAESLQTLRALGFVTNPNSTAPRCVFCSWHPNLTAVNPCNPRVLNNDRAVDSPQYSREGSNFMENHGLRVAGMQVHMEHCNAPETS